MLLVCDYWKYYVQCRRFMEEEDMLHPDQVTVLGIEAWKPTSSQT